MYWKKRKYARFQVPVQIDAPKLSDSSLTPEDISIGGFMVTAERKPEKGEIIECSIQIGEKTFEQCEAEIVWYRKDHNSDGEWECGLVLLMDENGRIEFAEELIDFVKELEKFVEQVKTVSIYSLGMEKIERV